MKNLVIILLVILILPYTTYAQENSPYGYYLDALRFSQTNSGGSARIQALGGSSITLGGDITSASNNPAGLGMYNRSEFSLTPGFTFNYNQANLNGSKVVVQNAYASFNNAGLVINNTKKGTKGWLGGSFGFSVNKINDFNNEFRYRGQNDRNSMVDFFVESAYGTPAGNFPALSEATDLTTLAYYNYLIGPWNVVDTNYPDNEYFSDITSFIRPSVQQEEIVRTHGGQYQWNVSYGGNLADVLYIGFGIGIVSLDYTAENIYTESNYSYPDDPAYQPLNQFNLTEKLSIRGTGFNSTFGLILRPISLLRIGASVTTPTVYTINDSYDAFMSADWNNFFYGDLIGGDTTLNYTEASSARVVSKYTLSTPLKASIGTSVFLGKIGFVTADIDYLDYRNIWLNATDFSMEADNNFIRDNFNQALNLKAGVEIRLNVIRLRAGYAINGVPLDADITYRSPNQRFSGGAGLRLNNFFADLTVMNMQLNKSYTPYSLDDNRQPEVKVITNNFSGLLTLGYKF